MGQTSKLRLNKWGYIDTDDSLATSMAGVFAGGDIVTGAATVIYPGKPRNPNEPGMADLLKRAEPFL